MRKRQHQADLVQQGFLGWLFGGRAQGPDRAITRHLDGAEVELEMKDMAQENAG